MTQLEREIEDDLRWREAELGSLKLLAASSVAGSDRYRALLRACVAMVYAHYEGFCKFCWDMTLEAIQARGLKRKELSELTAQLSMKPVMKALRANVSDESLWQFATTGFDRHLEEQASFPQKLETRSNLWPDLAKRNNEAIGLSCTAFTSERALLGQLVGKRNDIAHGKKLEIQTLLQVQELEGAAVVAMHELGLAVIDFLDNQKYAATIPPP